MAEFFACLFPNQIRVVPLKINMLNLKITQKIEIQIIIWSKLSFFWGVQKMWKFSTFLVILAFHPFHLRSAILFAAAFAKRVSTVSWGQTMDGVNQKFPVQYPQVSVDLLSQWLTFELLRIPYLVGKIKFKLFFRVHWLSECNKEIVDPLIPTHRIYGTGIFTYICHKK